MLENVVTQLKKNKDGYPSMDMRKMDTFYLLGTDVCMYILLVKMISIVGLALKAISCVSINTQTQ